MNKLTDLSDPAYKMSAPSRDPRNVTGYYQWANTPVAQRGWTGRNVHRGVTDVEPMPEYERAMEHPLMRKGFKPQYDVYVPPNYDPLNMGARTRMWGATLPSGSNWREMTERTSGMDEKAAKALYKYLSEGEMSDEDRSNLKYSDQTAYFNQAVQSQNRPQTVGHEGTHRAIYELADNVWGPGYIDNKTNMLMTRVMDYKYGNKAARKSAVEWIKGLSPDKTLEGGVKYAMPLIEELVQSIND